MSKQAFFLASTGQHVGKTTTSLGLLAGLSKHFPSVGFFKPVGQESTETPLGHHVDKDVLLIKKHFSLADCETTMSPVLFPRGFTREYLDGKVQRCALTEAIRTCFDAITARHPCAVVEGTGHVGVGSIVHLSNAKVASLLDLPMVLVASGGLGSSFDALCVNKALCDAEGVRVAGVILNRVLSEKREMILHYMEKALMRWKIPILGCIPFAPFLSNPSMKDFEILFHSPLLSGENLHFRHFHHVKLAVSSVKNFREMLEPNQLVITPAHREDIISLLLQKTHLDKSFAVGMILTGEIPPRQSTIEALQKAQIPMLHTPLDSYKTMKMITSYTVKIRSGDREKADQAIELAIHHIDFAALVRATNLG